MNLSTAWWAAGGAGDGDDGGDGDGASTALAAYHAVLASGHAGAPGGVARWTWSAADPASGHQRIHAFALAGGRHRHRRRRGGRLVVLTHGVEGSAAASAQGARAVAAARAQWWVHTLSLSSGSALRVCRLGGPEPGGRLPPARAVSQEG